MIAAVLVSLFQPGKFPVSPPVHPIQDQGPRIEDTPFASNFAKETLYFPQINPQSKALSGKYVFSLKKHRLPLLAPKYIFFF